MPISETRTLPYPNPKRTKLIPACLSSDTAEEATILDKKLHDARSLLILDLDETLIWATEEALDQAPDFEVGPYSVYKRPGVAEFLATAMQWFELAVWTHQAPFMPAKFFVYSFRKASN